MIVLGALGVSKNLLVMSTNLPGKIYQRDVFPGIKGVRSLFDFTLVSGVSTHRSVWAYRRAGETLNIHSVDRTQLSDVHRTIGRGPASGHRVPVAVLVTYRRNNLYLSLLLRGCIVTRCEYIYMFFRVSAAAMSE